MIASAALSIAATVLFFSVEKNYGIDFRGGTSIEVQAKGDKADPAAVREALSDVLEVRTRHEGHGSQVVLPFMS